MVVGHGSHGGRGRCYAIWVDFVKCLSDAGTATLDVCQPQREDYLECLHHRKLAARLAVIKERKAMLIKAGKWPPPESSQ